jgi:hypothetical protein
VLGGLAADIGVHEAAEHTGGVAEDSGRLEGVHAGKLGIEGLTEAV